MNACGARTRGGGLCKRAPGPTGRCNLHGKVGSGRPPKDGRQSKYCRVFGENYRALVNDPDILQSNAELALFDTFISERADLLRDGFSGEWLEDVNSALGALRTALFGGGTAQAAKAAFERLEDLTRTGGERVAAWEELLDKAAQRSALASKARSAEAQVRESDLIVFFGHMLRMVAEVVGEQAAEKLRIRFEREVVGYRVGVGEGAAGLPAGERAN